MPTEQTMVNLIAAPLADVVMARWEGGHAGVAATPRDDALVAECVGEDGAERAPVDHGITIHWSVRAAQ